MSNPGPATTSTDAFVGGGSPERIGTAATSKVGFYGVTPVVQASYVAALSTSAPTTAAFGFTTTQATALLAAVNSILAALEGVGIMAQS